MIWVIFYVTLCWLLGLWTIPWYTVPMDQMFCHVFVSAETSIHHPELPTTLNNTSLKLAESYRYLCSKSAKARHTLPLFAHTCALVWNPATRNWLRHRRVYKWSWELLDRWICAKRKWTKSYSELGWLTLGEMPPIYTRLLPSVQTSTQTRFPRTSQLPNTHSLCKRSTVICNPERMFTETLFSSIGMFCQLIIHYIIQCLTFSSNSFISTGV